MGSIARIEVDRHIFLREFDNSQISGQLKDLHCTYSTCFRPAAVSRQRQGHVEAIIISFATIHCPYSNSMMCLTSRPLSLATEAGYCG